jgi:transposase
MGIDGNPPAKLVLANIRAPHLRPREEEGLARTASNRPRVQTVRWRGWPASLRNDSTGCAYGTLLLYAAFNTKTGEVLGKTAERHTSAEFVAFLTDIVVNQRKGKEIHVIADNLSAHKTQRVDEFLAQHSNVHLHFTPTYSSWLNQVELWFAKIERDVIARGIFTSVSDLKRKLMRYIRRYNTQPKPVKWKYFDPSRRITPESIVTVH